MAKRSKKSFKKEGALELSISTIVVVVIGIALLSLGLIFVRGIFGKLGGQSDIIFGEAENEIYKIATHEEKLFIPQRVNVEAGKSTTFRIFLVDQLETEGSHTFTIQPPSSLPTGINIEFAGNSVTLNTNEEAGIVTGISVGKNVVKIQYPVTLIANGPSGQEYAR